MGDYFAARGGPIAKSDLGRFNVTGREEDRHMFKVPGLRNVAQTAPYFHDGAVPSLAGAVDTMARFQLGIELADADKRALVAFLQALSGRLPEAAP
jgi:cytochrome c peroxidase